MQLVTRLRAFLTPYECPTCKRLKAENEYLLTRLNESAALGDHLEAELTQARKAPPCTNS
jgi:hypothetical protein